MESVPDTVLADILEYCDHAFFSKMKANKSALIMKPILDQTEGGRIMSLKPHMLEVRHSANNLPEVIIRFQPRGLEEPCHSDLLSNYNVATYEVTAKPAYRVHFSEWLENFKFSMTPFVFGPTTQVFQLPILANMDPSVRADTLFHSGFRPECERLYYMNTQPGIHFMGDIDMIVKYKVTPKADVTKVDIHILSATTNIEYLSSAMSYKRCPPRQIYSDKLARLQQMVKSRFNERNPTVCSFDPYVLGYLLESNETQEDVDRLISATIPTNSYGYDCFIRRRILEQVALRRMPQIEVECIWKYGFSRRWISGSTELPEPYLTDVHMSRLRAAERIAERLCLAEAARIPRLP